MRRRRGAAPVSRFWNNAPGRVAPSNDGIIDHEGSGFVTQVLGTAGNAVKRPEPDAGSCSSFLIAGEVLATGEQLHSRLHGYAAQMCQDGSLVVSRADRPFPLWSTPTEGHPGASLAMLDGGDLVICSADGKVLWNSATAGNPGAFLQLHDDGRLVVHDFFRVPVWSSADI
jgi:hypothetical protein